MVHVDENAGVNWPRGEQSDESLPETDAGLPDFEVQEKLAKVEMELNQTRYLLQKTEEELHTSVELLHAMRFEQSTKEEKLLGIKGPNRHERNECPICYDQYKWIDPTNEQAEMCPKYMFEEPALIIHMCLDCRITSRQLEMTIVDNENHQLVFNLCSICRAAVKAQRRVKFFQHDLLCFKRREIREALKDKKDPALKDTILKDKKDKTPELNHSLSNSFFSEQFMYSSHLCILLYLPHICAFTPHLCILINVPVQ